MSTQVMEPPAEEVEEADGLPEDGWHEDTPMLGYLSWPFVSASLVNDLRKRTPAYAYWCLNGGGVDDETASKTLGSLTHTAVFEPDLLETEYAVEPEPDPERFRTANGDVSSNPRATGAFKEAVAELEKTGKTVVSADAMAKAKAMRDTVHGHPRARQLLRAAGPVEVSGVVTDPETGVRCKLRPDKLVTALGIDVNLKTTKNARWDQFTHDLYRYGYFVGLAFYKRLLPALDFDCRSSVIIAVETDGMHSVAVHEPDAGAIDAGEQLVAKHMLQLAECIEKDRWPGHSDDIESISLPDYAWTRVDEELMR